LLVGAANDLAYVVQAVVCSFEILASRLSLTDVDFQAPNFVWKTTDFPAARKGYTWSIVLNVLLSK
jgi:hypothetical protein